MRYSWDMNTPATCTRMCSKAGFAFSGVQYGVECFCGHDKPDERKKIPDNNCKMPCPDGRDTCGGKLAIDVYYTGVTVTRVVREPESVTLVCTCVQFTLTDCSRSTSRASNKTIPYLTLC